MEKGAGKNKSGFSQASPTNLGTVFHTFMIYELKPEVTNSNYILSERGSFNSHKQMSWAVLFPFTIDTTGSHDISVDIYQ